jgi:hypothetical protein
VDADGSHQNHIRNRQINILEPRALPTRLLSTRAASSFVPIRGTTVIQTLNDPFVVLK